MRPVVLCLSCLPLLACEPLSQVGRAPDFTAPQGSFEHAAHHRVPLPETQDAGTPKDRASLWSAGHRSLMGDRRASAPGDILTVVIEIDDSAQISNSTARGRSGTTSMAGPTLFGIPEAVDRRLPGGLSVAAGMETQGGTEFSGNGTVSRNEQLTLRVASTVVERLPSDILRIEGLQEVRVNHELRELRVTGFVRAADISRQNEIGYDKIANARISYGGRGVISTVQQPRYGSQILDIISPF